MIILTGGAGFIGANTLNSLNKTGRDDILIVDHIASTDKWKNLVGGSFRQYIHKQHLWEWFESNRDVKIEMIIHLGACSDTMEYDFDYHVQNNIEYTKKLWKICSNKQIPLIYASSAATYGDGTSGFLDDHKLVSKLQPINPYGYSKHLFDLWALKQKKTPSKWYGLKFFNVYGPYENHKGRMASVAYFTIPQAEKDGEIRLFKSYLAGYGNGEQKRDFVYVQDAIDIMMFFMKASAPSGLYNAGSGKASTFNALAGAIFKAMNKTNRIKYFDMPESLKGKYQYYTEADMSKLLATGYDYRPTSIEQGIGLYYQWYLEHGF